MSRISNFECIDDISCDVERILKSKFKLFIKNKEPLMLKGI